MSFSCVDTTHFFHLVNLQVDFCKKKRCVGRWTDAMYWQSSCWFVAAEDNDAWKWRDDFHRNFGFVIFSWGCFLTASARAKISASAIFNKSKAKKRPVWKVWQFWGRSSACTLNFSRVIGVHKPILACTTYQIRRMRRAALTYLSSRRTRDDVHIFFSSF